MMFLSFNSNKTGVTCGTGTAKPSEATDFTPVFSEVRVARSLVVCVCFVDRCLSFCPFSFGHCIVCPSITASDYPFGIFWPLYCLSFNYGFWLPLWYLLAIVLSVLQLRLLITPLVSFGHCVVCPTKGVIRSRNWRRTDNTMAKRYQRGNQKP
jgi:hypothetical protein